MGNCCFCFLVGWRHLMGYQSIPNSTSSTTTATQNRPAYEMKKRIRGKNQSLSEPVLEEELRNTRGSSMGFPVQFLKLYEVGAVVGVGTTSKVYSIYHRKRRRVDSNFGKLACKVIDKRKLTLGMDDEDINPLLEQLRKEVDILKRIHHPNVVSFYDFMETDSKLFIITEHLSGGELFDHIINHGPLEEHAACHVLYGVFSAVAYLHDRGVIHRDIKAENLIFFHTIGEHHSEISLKLIDFGFSTILKHDLTGSFMGTGGYIAPEIRQNKYYSMSVDSWSLGVLLYCTLSAKLPFEVSVDLLPNTAADCRTAFVLKFPPSRWAHISDSCKDLISHLLEFDPMMRYTAKDALLHPWFRSEHLRAKRLQEVRRTTPPLRQRSDSYSARAHIPKGNQNFKGTQRRVEELPSLASKLRPSHSTIQLEKRHSGLTDTDRGHSGSTTHSSNITSSQKESESGLLIDNQPADTSQNIMTAVVDGVFIDEDEFYLGQLSEQDTDKTNNTSLNNGVVDNNNCTLVDEIGVGELKRENSAFKNLHTADVAIKHAEDEAIIEQLSKDPSQSWRRSSAFIWEEMHDHLAGDLFYTSYERIKLRKKK